MNENFFAFLATLLIAHYVADFVLQSSLMALQKSERISVLVQHIGIHWLIFVALMVPWTDKLSVLQILSLSSINAVLHGLIDWNLWRTYKRWARKKSENFNPFDAENIHTFFLVLGLDQLLHGLSILFACWLVLK